ncbi:MAG: hypothetical protein NC816_05980 [Candidatus Omnitrophica bacterium]|nr:hypothetical protein [Candidatus Omnitrophota bacterium]
MNKKIFLHFLIFSLFVIIINAQEFKLQEGYGISIKYIGDKGIEKDPDIIFFEDFEINTLDELKKKWENISNLEIMSLSEDVPPNSAGKYSLLMTHIGGEGTGAHLYKRLLPGYNQLFVRFYVKFDSECAPIHHFFHIGGYNPPTPWPQGKAGERPKGNERFTIGIEPYGNSWRWDYYVYWMDMKGSPPEGKTWGNSFINNPSLKVEKNKWICVELMVKMNSPVSEYNGEMALWIDGKLVSHIGKGFPKGKWIYDKFMPEQGGKSISWNYDKKRPEYFDIPEGGLPFEGFRWRNDENLKLNFLWVLLYITKAPDGHISKVWFDHIIVAKKYIGPIYPYLSK